MFKRLVAAAAALLPTACDGPVTNPGAARSPAAYSHFEYVAGHGPMLLEVHNAPFGGGAEREDWIFRNFAGAVGPRRITFTRDVEQAVSAPDLRAILVFFPATDASPAQLCEGRIRTQPQSQPDRVDAMAVFCSRDQVLSHVSGWVRNLQGPEDRRLRDFLGQMRRDLFDERP
ncbi:hypothetical protein [Telmatospirillum sp. J64-1]|uniref:hypothetical protein n=1 Tax=Telmatospirillum sp. J64-1 TaxID=2502183 RepID=UPI00115D01A6|nr:hypothetical protein [Telmatospirillum sp. J64-1]